jgi:putative salt-induced outer membrane protein
MPKSATRLAALTAAMLTACPAAAEIPDPIRAMIDAAIASGDEDKVKTVIDLAKLTNPDDHAELDAILNDYEGQLAVQQAEAAAAQEDAIRHAGLFQNWTGKGELGAFRSTGNASNTGVTLGLGLTREGINWRHKLTARADYQESNGVATREQFLLAYEPNIRISDRLFAYALGQYERDRFQGFSSRYSASGGLGYDVIVEDDMTLSIKAGPAWRRTELIGGGSSSNLAGLAALDFDWAVTEGISLTQDASALIQSGSSTYTSDTGAQAAIAGSFSVRVSYSVEHDSAPPPGAVQTDTLSRVTLIYDF